MPRNKRDDVLAEIRAKAGRVLSQLEDHISTLESELKELVSHAEAWRGAIGERRPPSTPAKRPSRTRSPRVDWSEVLGSLPPRFRIDDVLKHPGAAAKGRAQVYPAFSRWEAAKQIRRVDKGVYEKTAKTSGGSAPKSGARGGKKRVARKVQNVSPPKAA